MDTAENLTQIGAWARDSFSKEQLRIELFLKLTRKNLNVLSGFPLSTTFDPGFKKFCESFVKLENEYKSGIKDHTTWAKGMIAWGATLTESIKLI